MASIGPSDNEKKHSFKLDDIISIANTPIPANSVEKYQIISFDIQPCQDPSQEFCNMIELAAFMFYKMEKQEAAQRKAQIEYRAAYNPSMN